MQWRRKIEKRIVGSGQPIEYWWGVGSFTVWTWSKALGVDRVTEGTSALFSRWAPETIQREEANRRREPTLKSPERAAKIAAAKRGKPMQRHVIQALIKANKGRKLSADQRRKMSEAHNRNGPPAALFADDGVLPATQARDLSLPIAVMRRLPPLS